MREIDHFHEILGPDHPLAIQVARSQLDHARALGDAARIETGEQGLASLRARRDERLRSERGKGG